MKKIFYALLLMLAVVQVAQAQEQGKFRVGLDAGYAMPSGGGGILFAIEPKYNIADNMNIGIRFESAAMAKNVNVGPASAEASLTASMSYSTSPHSPLYFAISASLRVCEIQFDRSS